MEFRRVGRREGRPLEGPFHQGTFHAGSTLPPHDAGGAKVHFSSQIVPSFTSRQIGNVGYPSLLGGYLGNSLSTQETNRGDRMIMAALGGAGSIASLPVVLLPLAETPFRHSKLFVELTGTPLPSLYHLHSSSFELFVKASPVRFFLILQGVRFRLSPVHHFSTTSPDLEET